MAVKGVRKTVIIVATLFVGIEWLLFELIRMPYRPPFDMSTFLGQEIFAIELFMGLLAFLWLIFTVYCIVTSSFSKRDYIAFCGALGVLFAAVGILVFFPPWPVTPFKLLW